MTIKIRKFEYIVQNCKCGNESLVRVEDAGKWGTCDKCSKNTKWRKRK